MRLLVASLFFSLILLSGALGLKTIQDCTNDPELDRDSELMKCYHTAAVTHAHLGQYTLARSICGDIWTEFGKYPMDPDSDVVAKAEMISNICYYDVALIAKDPAICEYIEDVTENNENSKLFGEAASFERCDRETRRLAEIAPEHYHKLNQDNLCAMVFVLPLFLLSVFYHQSLK